MMTTYQVIVNCLACGIKREAGRKRMRRHAGGSKKEASGGLKRILNMSMKSSSRAGSRGPREVPHNRHKLMPLIIARQEEAPLRILTSISATRIKMDNRAI